MHGSRSYKLIVLGDPEVGKTALQTYFCVVKGYKWLFSGARYFVDNIFFTIAHFPYVDTELLIHIWDLPALRDYVSPKYYEEVSSALLVYDIANRKSFENLENWKEELLRRYHTIPCVLVGNKKDQESSRAISKSEGMDLAKKWKIPFFETSARKSKSMWECFSILIHNTIAYHRIKDVLKEIVTSSSSLKLDVHRFDLTAFKMNNFLLGRQIPYSERSLTQTLRKAIITSLIQSLLKDDHGYIRGSSAGALGKIGTGNRQVITSLSQTLLKDEHWHVRSIAANALGDLGANEESINSLSTALLHDENEFVRTSAAGALGKIDDKRAITFLVKALRDEKKVVRRQSFESLKTFNYKIPEEKQLFLFLEDEAKFDRILHLVKKNPRTLEDIFLALKNSDVDSRAAKTLGKIGVGMPKTTAQVMPKLFEALKFYNAATWSIWSLGKIAEKRPINAEQIVPRLVSLLKDERWDVRYETARVIGDISIKSPELVGNSGAINILIELLSDEELRAIRLEKDKVQEYAVGALVKWLISQSKSLASKKQTENVFELMITHIKKIRAQVQPTNVKSIGRHFIPFFIQEFSNLFSTLLAEELWKGFQHKMKKIYFAPLKSVASVKAGLEEITKTLSNVEKILKKQSSFSH